MRLFGLSALLLIGGCAAVGTFTGQTRFEPFNSAAVFQYDEEGRFVTLYVEQTPREKRERTFRNDYGGERNWWDATRWEGVVDDSYLKYECTEAGRTNGERNCTLSQVGRCSIPKLTQRYDDRKCTAATNEKIIHTQILNAPELYYFDGRPSRFSASTDRSTLAFSFDGQPITSVSLITLQRAKKGIVYEGKLSGKDAKIACVLLSTGEHECRAHENTYGSTRSEQGSGFDYPRTSLGRSTVKFDEQVLDVVNAYIERFYPLERWPVLNPEKPYEIPVPVKTKTSAAQLMQEALTLYE